MTEGIGVGAAGSFCLKINKLWAKSEED